MASGALKCSLCQNSLYRSANLTKNQLLAKANDSFYIYCEVCINVFPYSSISNDEFKFINSDLNVDANLYNIYEQCSVFNFKSFNISKFNCCDFENDIDPNKFFFNSICARCDCYTVEQFVKSKTVQNGLPFIHFNARSLRTNFDQNRDHINELFVPFDIITISETWLDSEDCSDILLNGYNLIHRNRKK